MRRRVMRHDANHKDIVDTLRKCGAKVLDLSGVGKDCPDVLIAFRGRLILGEIKNPENWYGKKGLTEGQQRFADGWADTPVVLIRTIDDALRIIGAVK